MLKKKLIPYLVVVGLIVLIVAGALGVWVLQRYIPTKAGRYWPAAWCGGGKNSYIHE